MNDGVINAVIALNTYCDRDSEPEASSDTPD